MNNNCILFPLILLTSLCRGEVICGYENNDTHGYVYIQNNSSNCITQTTCTITLRTPYSSPRISKIVYFADNLSIGDSILSFTNDTHELFTFTGTINETFWIDRTATSSVIFHGSVCSDIIIYYEWEALACLENITDISGIISVPTDSSNSSLYADPIYCTYIFNSPSPQYQSLTLIFNNIYLIPYTDKLIVYNDTSMLKSMTGSLHTFAVVNGSIAAVVFQTFNRNPAPAFNFSFEWHYTPVAPCLYGVDTSTSSGEFAAVTSAPCAWYFEGVPNFSQLQLNFSGSTQLQDFISIINSSDIVQHNLAGTLDNVSLVTTPVAHILFNPISELWNYFRITFQFLCSKHITDNQPFGVIESPDNGGFYTDNLNCEWLFAAQNETLTGVKFTFSEVFLESDYDFLEISQDDGIVLYTLTGAINGTFFTYSTNARVRMTSDYAISYPSFSFLYEFVSISQPCNYVMINATGRIHGPTIPGTTIYPNKAFCTWRFPAGSDVMLTLYPLNLEDGFDFIHIKEGIRTFSLTGFYEEAVTVNFTTPAQMIFVSDDEGHNTTFHGYYEYLSSTGADEPSTSSPEDSSPSLIVISSINFAIAGTILVGVLIGFVYYRKQTVVKPPQQNQQHVFVEEDVPLINTASSINLIELSEVHATQIDT